MEANNQLQIVRQDRPEQEQEREYGCRYCQKKFSNKQALGGHQNAHKVERAMEKNELQDNNNNNNNIGYLGMGTPPSYSYYHHGRMNMNMNMAAPFITPYHRPLDFLHSHRYSHRFNPATVYSGWGRPPPPAFPQNVNVRFANFRPNQPMLGMRPNAAINLRNVPADESDDLDLSLKL